MAADPSANTARRVAQEVARLRAAYADLLPPDVIDGCIKAATEALADARIDTYVPVFVAREARRRLDTAVDEAG